MALNGKQQELLGVQLYMKLPYPDTPQAITNTIVLDTEIARRRDAQELAAKEALVYSDERAAELEYERMSKTGPMAKPKSDTLRGYKWMLRKGDGVNNVEFSQRDFPAFDGIIVENSGMDDGRMSKIAAFHPNHPHYDDFAPMRRNIALLRNYLLVRMEDDGGVLKSADGKHYTLDEKHQKIMTEMADRLGSALSSNTGSPPSFLSRWGKTVGHLVKGEDLSTPYTNAFMEAANIPDKGALVMYNYLQGLQETPTVKDIYSKDTPKHWPLLPREQTPFSDDNMAKYSRSSMMMGAVDAYEQDVMSKLRDPEKLRAPENLNEEDQRVSVKLAEEILERLRNMMSNPEEQSRMSQFTDEDHDKTRKLLTVAMGFKDALATIEDAEPGAIQNNKIIAQSIVAFEKMGFRMKVEAHKMLVEEYEPTAGRNVEKSIEQTPATYKTNETSESLLSQIDSGLKEAARIQAQARIAQKIQQRAAQRETQRSLSGIANGSRLTAGHIAKIKGMDKFKGVQMKGGETFSTATIRGASNSSVSRAAQEAQDKAFADKLKEQADAPFLTDTNRGR